jgi:Ca2+-transporting ATPase
MVKKIHDRGLTPEQVIASRREHGDNVLTPPRRDPLWRQFLAKFDDPLI